MNGRGGFIAAIFLVVFGLAIGGGSVRASPLVADYPGSKALATVLAKAADAYEETSVRIPPHVARQDLLLLALNVYYEARGEGISGKAAVAHVPLNRLTDARLPPTLAQTGNSPRRDRGGRSV